MLVTYVNHESPCHDGKQMSDWQDKGHSIKIALLAKAVSKAALMLPVLALPGSPGTHAALTLAARQGLRSTSLLRQQWWQLEEKCPDTSKKVS